MSKSKKCDFVVTGVDPGTTNLANMTLRFTGDEVHVIHKGSNEAVVAKGRGRKATMAEIWAGVKAWWDRHDGFPDSHVIRVEQQMKKKLIFLSGCILGLAGDRGELVVPKVWRNYLGLAMGEYTANKRISASVCQSMTRELFADSTKKDDHAEAYLIAVHAGLTRRYKGRDKWEIYKYINPSERKQTCTKKTS
jgi:hypothetical protein